MRALPSIYTKIYLIFFLALHAEYRVRVLRTVDFNLAKVIQDFSGFFSKVWKYKIVLKYICIIHIFDREFLLDRGLRHSFFLGTDRLHCMLRFATIVKFGYSEKATKFEKIFLLKFDTTQ